MWAYAVWLSTLGIKTLLIGASLSRRTFKTYPVFHAYLVLTTTIGLWRLYIYAFQPQDYLAIYWWTQFAILAAGFGVTWEIFGQSLQHYQGVRKMARFVVSNVFVILLLQFGSGIVAGQFAAGIMRLERNMRGVEIVLLGSLLALILYYGLSLGRNVSGLLLGYGLYLTSNMIALTLHTAVGLTARYWLDAVRQSCELLAALVWLAMLWRFDPIPAPGAERALEEDYAVVAERTLGALSTARREIVRLFNP